MQFISALLWLGASLVLLPNELAAQERRRAVPIVVAAQAASAERLAAGELAVYLASIYPRERFVVKAEIPETGPCILLGTATDDVRIKTYLADSPPPDSESFKVFVVPHGARQIAVIAGGSPRGAAYGVYALLEKLGCGFYLSYDALPSPAKKSFSFEGWALSDKPLVPVRLVFDWHNFLSGCSTWNLPEWKSWITQSLKMRYNAIMVHAYGNNPMVTFSFNGKTKPVGYVSTTAKGRDWSTMHVNDVRRLWGGQVFDQPIFGADAAIVPDERRAEAAQKLMQHVFACAKEHGMDVYFANDVDTLSANPQELIATLPPEARFSTGGGKTWLANPETAEGYGYYKQQVQTLLDTYPEITCLVTWFRNGGTPWMELKLTEMPPAWQKEYEAETAGTPEAARCWHAPQIFALGKIVRAFDRALKELGRDNVQLACGTWRFEFLAACHRFFPPHVKLIGLDYDVLHDHSQLRDSPSLKTLSAIGAQREVIPVIWAHHDDGNYLGRSYTPFSDFATRLSEARAGGFGIIHWTTRPLDLFFASHIKQVWQSTRDQPLAAACSEMAAKSLGVASATTLGHYLERWVTGAPKFSRETSDHFIDRPVTNLAHIAAESRKRLALLEATDLAPLTQPQRDRVHYFEGLERFILAVHQTQAALQDSKALLAKGDLAGARTAIAEAHPEQVIEQYAKFSSLGGITRGEQGSVVSMNLRWLPDHLRHRQSLGLEPARYNFGPTSHETLAQSAGRFTWHFDTGHRLWRTLGAEETGARVFVVPPKIKIAPSAGATQGVEEICRAGIESDRPLDLTIEPVMGKAVFPAGQYVLCLLWLDPDSRAPNQRVFTISITTRDSGAAKKEPLPKVLVQDRIDVFQATGAANRILTRRYPITLSARGSFTLRLTPEAGAACLSGLILSPADSGGN